MAKANGIRKVKEVALDEMELVCSTEKYNALGEKDITVVILQIASDGEYRTAYQICKDDEVIATINPSGKVNLRNEYKGQLKLIDEQYYKSLGLDDSERLLKTDVELELAKQHVRTQNNKAKSKEKLNNEKEEQVEDKEKAKEQTDKNVKKIENDLDLPEDDLVACTEIRDARFYRDIPEAREGYGFTVIAYSKSEQGYITASRDLNGKMKKLQTIIPSVNKSGATKQIGKEGVSEKSIQNVMNVKGSNDAYSVRIDSLSSEIKMQELRYDDNSRQYMAAEMYTVTQRPTQKQADLIDKGKNKEVSDEMEMIAQYKEAGYNVPSIEMISENTRDKFEILSPEEIEEQINEQTDSEAVKREVRKALLKQNPKIITREIVNNEIDELEEEYGEKTLADRPIKNHH